VDLALGVDAALDLNLEPLLMLGCPVLGRKSIHAQTEGPL